MNGYVLQRISVPRLPNTQKAGWQGWRSVPLPSFSFGNASSVPMYAAKTVLDAFQRPSCPGHREELEPLVDEDIGVHVRRDEVHARYDPVLLAGRRDVVQAGLIGGAGVLQRHTKLNREVRRADQQHIDPADAENRID